MNHRQFIDPLGPTPPFSFKEVGRRGSPRVVFLHGLMGKKEDWEFPALSLEKHFHCLLVDLPGHGSSTASSFFPWGLPPQPTLQESSSFSTISHFLGDFLKQEGRDLLPVHLVGYSLGGRLALHLALTFPSLFSSLTLESAHPGLESASEREKRREEDFQLFASVTPENFPQFLDQWFRQNLFGHLFQHPEYPRLLKERTILSPQTLQLSLKWMSVGGQDPQWERIGLFPRPILFLSGERDEKYRQIGEKLNDSFPQLVTHRVAPASGHNVHFQNPSFFLKALLDHIGQ